jgi:hypothetical protein
LHQVRRQGTQNTIFKLFTFDKALVAADAGPFVPRSSAAERGLD